MTQPTESGEQYPKSAMEWLEDALGRFQITHCHASIREALKAMDTTEAAIGGKVRCAAKDSEGLRCVLEHGHTRNSHVIHQVDDGASLWPSVPSIESVKQTANTSFTNCPECGELATSGVFLCGHNPHINDVTKEVKRIGLIGLPLTGAHLALHVELEENATLRQQLEEAKRGARFADDKTPLPCGCPTFYLYMHAHDRQVFCGQCGGRYSLSEAKLAALGVGGGEVELPVMDVTVEDQERAAERYARGTNGFALTSHVSCRERQLKDALRANASLVEKMQEARAIIIALEEHRSGKKFGFPGSREVAKWLESITALTGPAKEAELPERDPRCEGHGDPDTWSDEDLLRRGGTIGPAKEGEEQG